MAEAERNTSPILRVIPSTKEDVCTIIRICLKYGCKVVPRSGGHQYCGLSSGSSESSVVQIDMKNFDEVRVGRDNASGDKYVEASVGAGAGLKKLYSEFCKRDLLFPGGNCLNVAIGGHLQSSASGHFTKSFGLGLDLVTETEIVLANGKLVKASAKEHPDLFWAIRGGSPGAFGVVIGYKIKAIKITKYEDAYLARFIWRYDRETCRQVLSNFVNMVKHPAHDQCRDATLSFTIGPNLFSSNHTHLDIIVTMMWTGIDRGSIRNSFSKSPDNTEGATYYDIFVASYLDIKTGVKDATEIEYPQYNLSSFTMVLALPDPAGPIQKSFEQATGKVRHEPKAPQLLMGMAKTKTGKAVQTGMG